MTMKNSRGFTLLGLVVALGIVALLMTGFLNFFTHALKGSRNVANLGEYGDVLSSLRLVLRSSPMCRCNLAPGSPAPRTFSEAGVGAVSFAVDAIHRYTAGCSSGGQIVGRSIPIASGLTLRELQLRDFLKVDDGNYMAKLHLEVDKPAGSMGGPGYIKDFQIAFKTTTANGTVTLNDCVIAGEDEPQPSESGSFWSISAASNPWSPGGTGFTIPSGKTLVISQVSLRVGNPVGGEVSTPTFSGFCSINGAQVYSITNNVQSSGSMGAPLAISGGSTLSFSTSSYSQCFFAGYLVDET